MTRVPFHWCPLPRHHSALNTTGFEFLTRPRVASRKHIVGRQPSLNPEDEVNPGVSSNPILVVSPRACLDVRCRPQLRLGEYNKRFRIECGSLVANPDFAALGGSLDDVDPWVK